MGIDMHRTRVYALNAV